MHAKQKETEVILVGWFNECQSIKKVGGRCFIEGLYETLFLFCLARRNVIYKVKWKLGLISGYTYTCMMRKVQNISWKDKVTNNFLYGSNPCLTDIVRRKRLSLAGCMSRHNEPAGRVLLWEPDEWRRLSRPKITLKKILEDDTGLEAHELQILCWTEWVGGRILPCRFSQMQLGKTRAQH